MTFDVLRVRNKTTPAAELKALLKPCPICGAKAFLSHDVVDGFELGYSVGCPRYCNNDGIHGHDENTPKEERLTIFGLLSPEDAVKAWNERVQNYDL